MTAWNMSAGASTKNGMQMAMVIAAAAPANFAATTFPCLTSNNTAKTATGTTAHIFTVMPNPSSSPATIGCGVRAGQQDERAEYRGTHQWCLQRGRYHHTAADQTEYAAAGHGAEPPVPHQQHRDHRRSTRAKQPEGDGRDGHRHRVGYDGGEPRERRQCHQNAGRMNEEEIAVRQRTHPKML